MKNWLGMVLVLIGGLVGLLLGGWLVTQVDSGSFLRWSGSWPRHKWPTLLEAACELLGMVLGLALLFCFGWKPESRPLTNERLDNQQFPVV